MRGLSLVFLFVVGVAASWPCSIDAVKPAGLTYRMLSVDDVDEILSICRSNDNGPCRFSRVQSLLFGHVYDPTLSDLVVYMDSCASCGGDPYRIQAALVRGKRSTRDLVLTGERKTWVVLISDQSLRRVGDLILKKKAEETKPLGDTLSKSHEGKPKSARKLPAPSAKSDAKGKDRDEAKDAKDEEKPEPEEPDSSIAIRVRLEPLVFAPSSGERTIRDVLAALFEHFAPADGDKGAEKGETEPDKLIMELRGRGSRGDLLYVGVIGLDVQTNSVNRVVLHPVGSGSVRSMHINFSQFSASRLGGSLGLGYRFRKSSHETQGDRIGAYLMANYYVKRPRLPVDTRCYGPVLGTSLTNGITKSLVIGARGTLVGQSGLWGGINLLSGHVFQEGIVVGVDYRL